MTTSTAGGAPALLSAAEAVLTLPGPAPLVWDAGPRSAVVVVGHAGDALAGFAIGLHAMLEAGWTVSLVTAFDEPDAGGRVPAVDVAFSHLGRELDATLHLGPSDQRSDADLDDLLRGAVAGHDMVIGPADLGGGHPQHSRVAHALDRLTDASYRFLLPGQRIAADRQHDLRRVSAPAEAVRSLQQARAELALRMPCLGRDGDRAVRVGMLTESDAVLVAGRR